MSAPPHLVIADFLPPENVAALLADALAMEARFQPSTIHYGSGGQGVDPRHRVSATLGAFGPQQAPFRQRLLDALPRLAAALAVPAFTLIRTETELVAHGDGAFFTRHLDGSHPDRRQPGHPMRMISGVYYFHAGPKGFSGGQLRLYGMEADAPFHDVEPLHNSLVVFPAWLPHEVLKVSCPSGRFADSRFAVNCWFHGVPK
jgi:Rps23 Pro-64 3,4-dihydroxylase Tpa1-like proline 4-hydroxylase